MKIWYLYAITNLVNGKRYVGISIDYERRWRDHRSGHGSKLVYQAIKKYGLKKLKFQVVCKGLEDYVKEMEIRAIRMLNTAAHSGYNLTEGGDGSTGWKPSDETRKRMRDSHRGTTGQKHSDATKQKMREAGLKYKRGKHARATKVVVNGKHYECIRDVAEDLDVPYSTLCAFWQKQTSDTFEYPPKVEKITINGVPFNTLKEAAKSLGVLYQTLWHVKRKQGGSNTFDYQKGRLRGSKHPCARKITVNGIEYGSIKEAAEKLGVNYSTLRDARRRAQSNTFTYQPKGVLTP